MWEVVVGRKGERGVGVCGAEDIPILWWRWHRIRLRLDVSSNTRSRHPTRKTFPSQALLKIGTDLGSEGVREEKSEEEG